QLALRRTTAARASQPAARAAGDGARHHHIMGAAQSAAMEGLAEQVNMSKEEIQRMYVRFKKLDKNNSGGIDAQEFMQIANIANNPLAQRVISIFDDDGGGEVEFEEFVRVRRGARSCDSALGAHACGALISRRRVGSLCSSGGRGRAARR